jgi:hypothetical protein
MEEERGSDVEVVLGLGVEVARVSAHSDRLFLFTSHVSSTFISWLPFRTKGCPESK